MPTSPINVKTSPEMLCSNCAKAEVNLWCKRCEASYCSSCYELAHTLPALKTHESVPIHQRPIILASCSQHPDEKLKFWCSNCATLVCRDCILVRHQGHTPTEITVIAEEKATEQRSLFTKVEQELEQFIKQTAARIMSNEDTTIESITRTFDSLRSIISNYENELKQKVCVIEKRNRDLLEPFEKQLKEKKEELNKRKGDFESIFSSKNYTKLLQDHQQTIGFLNNSINELSQMQYPTKIAYYIEEMNVLELSVNEILQRLKVDEWQQDIPSIPPNTRWSQNGITVAGGNGQGNDTNQLDRPNGLWVDDNQAIIIADRWNDRIVQWKKGDTTGQVVAGGNGQGNRLDQLNRPTDVLIDKETDSLIICDSRNRRVVRWSRHSDTTQGEILIDDIDCWGLAMDDLRNLYISDYKKHEIQRYQIGDNKGSLVAGGNGKGADLNQLNWPRYIFVDRQQTIYVSDWENHRVIKWHRNATKGIVVVGGEGQGNAFTQSSKPNGLFVDTSGAIYVQEELNHRVTRWSQGAQQGTLIIGGRGPGSAANQLKNPVGLFFDRHGNLYTAEFNNHRVQRFSMQ